jgi:hypothetical protein
MRSERAYKLYIKVGEIGISDRELERRSIATPACFHGI